MGRTVLVVDDDNAARDGLACLLQGQGFVARQAPHGEAALRYLREGGPADVILLDLVMPVMDGWTFRRAQLSDPWLADIPVIVISALGGRPSAGISFASASFTKPINVRGLMTAVERLCAACGSRAIVRDPLRRAPLHPQERR